MDEEEFNLDNDETEEPETEAPKVEIKSPPVVEKQVAPPVSNSVAKVAPAVSPAVSQEQSQTNNTSNDEIQESSKPETANETSSLKDKLLARAERFGIPPSEKTLQQLELEKKKLRAERFGLPMPSAETNQPNEKLQKRMERFGPVSEQAKKQVSEKNLEEEVRNISFYTCFHF